MCQAISWLRGAGGLQPPPVPAASRHSQAQYPLGESAREAPRCLALGSRPLPCQGLSSRRLPAGGKAGNAAPAPGQPPHDESDRKTEPHSSVSDLVNSLTSEMLMVGGWGAPGLGVSTVSIQPSQLLPVPSASAPSCTSLPPAVPRPRRAADASPRLARGSERCRTREGGAVRRNLVNWSSRSAGRVAPSQEGVGSGGGSGKPGRG